MPKIFTDHMVLQRDVPIHVWGWAPPGEAVKVTVGSESASASADPIGKWSVTLPALPAGGGPLKLTIAGKNTVAFDDILMGDLWMASGQSNMQFPLSGWSSAPMKDSAAEIATANIPEIRLLTVRNAASVYPLADLKDSPSWQVCSSRTAADFSAVAFLFAREIHEKIKIPIGLIDSTWGGTPVESWVGLDAMAHTPAIVPVMSVRADDMNAEADLQQKWDADASVASQQGKPAPGHGSDPANGWGPGTLYNAMIAPFTGLPVKGVLWYQGETNTTQSRSPYYETAFETLITDWRRRWKQPEMPFFFVQLASYGSGPSWPAVQDAQRRSLRLNKTGMAVAVDVGEEKNVHPANKQSVAHRLALQAEAQVYGETVVKDGPLFTQATPMGATIQVTFDSAVGLKARDGAPGSFEVAGADGVFSPATATIQGDKVIAQSAAVPAPMYVRYAWAGFPAHANLYNGADLPAATFTSQDPGKR